MYLHGSIAASQVALVVKDLPASSGNIKSLEFDPWVGKIPRGGNGNPLQYSCQENQQRSLVGYSPCGCKESDMTEVI